MVSLHIQQAPEDMGLGTVTFRAADREDSDEVLMMIGNNGCELVDLVDNSGPPYFWGRGPGMARSTCPVMGLPRP